MQKFPLFLAQDWNQCNCGLFLAKFGCHGNSLGSIEILDSIFEFTNPENFTIRAKKIVDFLHRTKISAILAYFLPKFGCHGNSLGSLEILNSIFELANPEILTIHAKKLLDFLHIIKIFTIFFVYKRSGVSPRFRLT